MFPDDKICGLRISNMRIDFVKVTLKNTFPVCFSDGSWRKRKRLLIIVDCQSKILLDFVFIDNIYNSIWMVFTFLTHVNNIQGCFMIGHAYYTSAESR